MLESKFTYVSLESDERIHGEDQAALIEVEREFGERHPIYIGGREVTARREFEARSPIDPGILLGTFQEGERRPRGRRSPRQTRPFPTGAEGTGRIGSRSSGGRPG